MLTLLLAPLALERGGGAAAVSAAIYEGAGLICHQRPERSFHLAGVPMPVCARCSGLYFSGAAGALLAWSRRRNKVTRPRSSRLVLLAAALPTALSVAGELAGVIPSSNSSRMIAALPLGAAAGWIFVRSLRSEAEPERPAVAL